MDALTGALRREPASVFLVGAVGLLAASVVAGFHPELFAPFVLMFVVLAAWHRVLLGWPSLVGLLILVVLVVPIKQYKLPASLPFDLELYRVLVAAVLLGWLTSLLIDPRVSLHRTAFDKPLLVIVGAVFASELANPGRVTSLSSYVAKSFAFFLSFVLLYFFTVSVIRTRRSVEVLVKVLVGGATAVAAFAVVERRTGYNVFYHLDSVLPFLSFEGIGRIYARSGRLRVIGSAQHPIALGAMFAMLFPLAFYLARRAGRFWWLAVAGLSFGVLATASRTAVVMLIVIAAVFFWLKRAETKRLAPLLVPMIVAVHFVVPGALVTVKEAFFPAGGIVAEQTRLGQGENPELAGGRLRQLRPMLDEWSHKPVVGEGWGTRVSGFNVPFRNAPILDDQWLNTLLELGAVGFAAWIWLLVRAVRRLGRAAKRDDEDSWLYVALAASIAAFGVGMATFDAFSFIQVTFVFWFVLAVAGALLSLPGPAARPTPIRTGP